MDNNKELIPSEDLLELIKEWLKSFIDDGISLSWYRYGSSRAGDFDWHLTDGSRNRVSGAHLCGNHWDIYNAIYRGENVNIELYSDYISLNENSTCVDHTKEEMYSLYTFLKERIFGIKEETKEDENKEENIIMNDKKELISNEELLSLISEWKPPEWINLGGQLELGSGVNCSALWRRDSSGEKDFMCGSYLDDDHWVIHDYRFSTCTPLNEIKIFNDHIEFEESKTSSPYLLDYYVQSRDRMYSLYTFLNERIFDITEEKKEEENNKMNDKKELMSQDKLTEIISNYIKPVLDECDGTGGIWCFNSREGSFYWSLYDANGGHDRYIGACLRDDRWQIYNKFHVDKNVNIEIYSDKRVTFHANSEFNNFSEEFMRGLYDKITQDIEYNSTINRVVIEIDLDRDRNDLTKLMGSFHNIFTGQTEYVNNDIVLSSDKPFNGKEFDGNVAEIIYNLAHENYDSISRMLNDLKKVIDVIAYNNLQEPEFYEYFRDYNTYVDEVYYGISSDNGKITRKKRDVPLKTMEEICKENGVKWKPNNDNPNNNIKVDSEAEVNTFGDGAVRSSKKGKGRYDLIPGCVMVDVLNEISFNAKPDISDEKMKCILMKRIFAHDWINVIVCLTELGYDGKAPIDSFNKMIKDLAIHYENGAEIYGENNWKKGIPIESFISSGIRHTQQYLAGLTDEPHLISAIWNFCNATWCVKQEELRK